MHGVVFCAGVAHPEDSEIGVYVPDKEGYDRFMPLLSPIIAKWHYGNDPAKMSQPAPVWDSTELKGLYFDPQNEGYAYALLLNSIIDNIFSLCNFFSVFLFHDNLLHKKILKKS